MAQLEHITPDQIAQYGVVAAPDRLTGRAQDNKAIFDRLVRELVALVVNDIIDRTNELLIAEDTREENEADRIAAENLRVQAENLRVQAENIRVENEQSRVQAEASRVAAELLRVQAESLRVSAEQSRVSAEAEREAAEALRESTTSGIVVRATEQAEAAERSATRALNAEQGASNYERAAGESAANAAAFSQNAKNFASDAESSSADAEASAIAAAESVKRSPYIDPNKKTWFVWDSNTGAFVDTGIVAEGQSGIEADGLWGVYVDEEGFLVVTYTGDDPPPLSISDDGYLVYTLNGQEIQIGKTVGPVGPVGPAGLGVPEATPEDADKIPIVAPDGTYKLGYQSGAIDDTKAQTDKTWSSLTIVDRLAPAFESSGPVVTCNPVEGYPLHVVSQIVPVQSGSGDPSPENVRPISGWAQATLTHNDTPIPLSFGQTVYGGTLDWTTGVLTIDKIVVLVNSEILISCSGVGRYSENLTNFYINLRDVLENPTSALGENAVSNQFKLRTNEPQYRTANIFFIGAIGTVNAYISFNIENTLVGIDAGDSNDVAVQKLKSYLNANPISFVVSINSPQIVQLTPQEILALSGTNTLYTDTGDTTVSGRADPNAIIQQLASRIAALEGAATNL